MSIRASLIALGIMIIAILVFVATQILVTVTGDHDGWDIFAPVSVTTDAVTVEPPNLLTQEDRESLNAVVSESRTYGIPWSVYVASEDEFSAGLEPEVIAERIFSQDPVESREGAGDGLLMVVIVPEEDRTETAVEFVAGPNFYPMGGITPERLQYIADVQMEALIEEERIGDAVIEGATWVEWTQLFEPTPDPPPSNLEMGLQDLLEPLGAVGFAGLALLIAGITAYVIVATRRSSAVSTPPELDAITAAAAARGRVDHAVIASVVLDAIDRGMLLLSGTTVKRPAGTYDKSSMWDRELTNAFSSLEQRRHQPTLASLTRTLSSGSLLQRHMEDHLAAGGIFARRAQVHTVVLRIVAIVGLALGAIGIVLSVLGESDQTLVASFALSVISLIVLIWNEHRSWTTRAGMRAAASWRDRHSAYDDRERLVYETIMGFENLDTLPASKSPVHPDSTVVIPALRS